MAAQVQPLFENLVSCIRRIALPPVDDYRMSAPVAFAVAKLRDSYVVAHENALQCIETLERAYSLLVVENSPFDSSPEAAALLHLPLSPPLPNSFESSANYAKHIALSTARRDESFMNAVFARHKDAEGGLSKTALMAALREVEAPVLSSSEFTSQSEDDLFRRADSNLSGAVDQNEYVFPPFDAHLEWRKFACRHGCLRRFMITANLPDDLEMFLSYHNLSVST
jgi:hypothetical protein